MANNDPVASPPTARDPNPAYYTGTEDLTLSVGVVNGVRRNDTDPNGDSLTAVLDSGPSHDQSFTFNNNGSFSYRGTSNWNGTDTFTYHSSDGRLDLNTATVTITIDPVNDPPSARDDTALTDEDTSVNIPVLGNDTDVDDAIDPTSVTAPATTTYGSTSINPVTGVITYTPNIDSLKVGETLHDIFTYQVCDTGTPTACATASVDVTILGVNDPPSASSFTFQASQDVADQPIDVLAHAFDAEGDPMTIVAPGNPGVTTSQGGTATWNNNGTPGDPSDDWVDYTPPGGFHSTSVQDLFSFQVQDSNGANSNVATVNIWVNDPPVANDDPGSGPAPTPDPTFYSMSEDGGILVVSADNGVLANDTDSNGDSLSVASHTYLGTGTLNVYNDGSFDYTPASDFNGTDTFSYRATDGQRLSASPGATVTITVSAINDPPEAADDPSSGQIWVNEGDLVDIDVLANDSDVDGNLVPASVNVTVGPLHGITSVNALTGEITYQADTGVGGASPVTDTFTYTVQDDGTPLPAQTSNQATVTVHINRTPISTADSYSVNEDSTLTVTPPVGVLFNDNDPDNDALTASLVTDVTNGALALSSDGSFTYSPDLNWNSGPGGANPDSFTYRACDPGGLCSPDTTVSITVNPMDDAPVANNDPVGSTPTANDPNPIYYAMNEDGGVSGTPLSVSAANGLLANDTDPDNLIGPLNFGLSVVTPQASGPSHEQFFTLNSDGSFDYMPVANYSGTDSFTYQVTDGGLTSVPAMVTITINSVNDAPVANDDPTPGDPVPSTLEDTPFHLPVLANDTDVDGDVLTVNAVTNGAHGMVVNNTTDVIYTPDPDWFGDDSFTYQITDGTRRLQLGDCGRGHRFGRRHPCGRRRHLQYPRRH